LTGSAFTKASTVSLNSSALQTTFVSATQLTAVLPTADESTEGKFNVTVVNPSPGGGTSSAKEFDVDGTALAVNIIDLPAGTPANVKVTGPNGLNLTLTSGQTITGAEGTYTVTAVGVPVGTSTYYATKQAQSVTLSAGNSATLTVDYYSIIPNTTKVLDQTGMQSLSISSDGTTITISSSSTIAGSLAVGDVLASAPTPTAPNGLLVKILTVSQSGSNTVATVGPATLEDAIEQANFSLSQTLDPTNIQSQVQQGMKFSRVRAGSGTKATPDTIPDSCSGNPSTFEASLNTPVLQITNGGISDSINASGSLEICPSFEFDFHIGFFKLDSLKAVATLGEHAHLSVSGDVQGTISKTINLGPPITFQTIVVFVGDVPVVVTPQLQFYVQVDGTVQAGFTVGVTQDAQAQGGLSYSNGTTSPIHTVTFNGGPDTPVLDGGISVKGSAGAELDLLVYGTLAPHLGIDLYLQFDADPTANPWWTVSAGIEGDIGVKVTVLGEDLADLDIPDVFNFSEPIGQATGGFTVLAVTPALTSISPTFATVGSSSLSLAITGSNFVPGAFASFNGLTLPTSFQDPSDLTAVLPSTALTVPGVFSVTVTNPDTSGAISAPVYYSVVSPTPVISSVSPNSLAVGPFSLTVLGSNFVSGAQVSFGGTLLTTSFVSSTQLTATGTATSGQVGTVAVRVINPGPTSPTSTSLNVTVTAAPPVTVTVSPLTAQVIVNGLQQFTATVTNTSNTAVTWSVNGTTGGSSTLGTISTTGLYTAPATVPNPAAVTVKATSQAFTTVSASASVTIGPYTETPVYSFTSLSDGAAPSAPLIQASDGFYYGTTQVGGANSYGTAFKVDSSGNVTPLHEFAAADGAYPTAALVVGSDGYFYGTTFAEGNSSCAAISGYTGCGTAFKMDSSGNLTPLHSFAGGTEGAGPETGLIIGTDGYLYGTTGYGGTYNTGTVFQMDSSGNVNTLYSFSGGTDGGYPEAGLIQGTDGYFYGTTLAGGDLSCEIWGIPGCGTIFKIDSAGSFTTLYSFTGGADGANPIEDLIQATDGYFYGTSAFGGDTSCTVSGYTGCGTIFEVDSTGILTPLHQFSGGAEGGVPVSALIQASDGDFYGTATAGGDSSCSVTATGFAYPTYIGCGTVFQMDSAGDVNALYSFTGTPNDGSNPFASIVEGSDGFLYGTTRWGGTDSSCSYTNNGGCGTVFKVSGPGGPLPLLRTGESKRSVLRPLNLLPLPPQTIPVPKVQTGQKLPRAQSARGLKQPSIVK
jgi:uncharacterized repeat protein (TIGR03803 family)